MYLRGCRWGALKVSSSKRSNAPVLSSSVHYVALSCFSAVWPCVSGHLQAREPRRKCFSLTACFCACVVTMRVKRLRPLFVLSSFRTGVGLSFIPRLLPLADPVLCHLTQPPSLILFISSLHRPRWLNRNHLRCVCVCRGAGGDVSAQIRSCHISLRYYPWTGRNSSYLC